MHLHENLKYSGKVLNMLENAPVTTYTKCLKIMAETKING